MRQARTAASRRSNGNARFIVQQGWLWISCNIAGRFAWGLGGKGGFGALVALSPFAKGVAGIVGKLNGIGVAGGAGMALLALVLSPALAATSIQSKKAPQRRPAISLVSGEFTPAVADPRLAAEFARRGVQSGSFRFTPPAASADKSKAVKVAIRARTGSAALASRSIDTGSASAVTAITPAAYNLGVAVGWKRFALSGDIAKVEGGPLPGGREAAELGLSYSGKAFTGRVAVGAERGDERSMRVIPVDSSYSLDVGGSYRLTGNIDLTAGARYKIQSDRLQPLADERRDSQAVYIGTAFRF
jgi:hypothetical protein